MNNVINKQLIKGVTMEKNILPITTPVIQGFSHQAALLSIMMSYEKCKPWICNNYLQVFTLHDLKNAISRLGTLDFFYMDYADFNKVEYKANPWIRYSETPLLFIDIKEASILSMLINVIDSDLYVTVDIDKYYIPQYEQVAHTEHTILIYGYDLTKNVFYCSDNFKEGKYSSQKVNFHNLIAAINSRIESFRIEIKKMSPNNPGPIFSTFGIANTHQDKNYTGLEIIDLKRIIYFLTSYIEPDSFYMTKSENNYYTYGIQVYNEIIDYFVSSIDENNHIDIRAYYSLMDHKSLMIWRLNYIQNKLKIDLEFYIDAYLKLKHEIYRHICVIVKYNMKRKIGENTLIDSIKKCRDDECKISAQLIMLLESFNK